MLGAGVVAFKWDGETATGAVKGPGDGADQDGTAVGDTCAHVVTIRTFETAPPHAKGCRLQ